MCRYMLDARATPSSYTGVSLAVLLTASGEGHLQTATRLSTAPRSSVWVAQLCVAALL